MQVQCSSSAASANRMRDSANGIDERVAGHRGIVRRALEGGEKVRTGAVMAAVSHWVGERREAARSGENFRRRRQRSGPARKVEPAPWPLPRPSPLLARWRIDVALLLSDDRVSNGGAGADAGSGAGDTDCRNRRTAICGAPACPEDDLIRDNFLMRCLGGTHTLCSGSGSLEKFLYLTKYLDLTYSDSKYNISQILNFILFLYFYNFFFFILQPHKKIILSSPYPLPPIRSNQPSTHLSPVRLSPPYLFSHSPLSLVRTARRHR
jgi:hypothetical protein